MGGVGNGSGFRKVVDGVRSCRESGVGTLGELDGMGERVGDEKGRR